MNKIVFDNENNLVTQCYEAIQNSIINGTFEPGKKLKTKELKLLLNVGQSPIREALSRLAMSGLVDMQDNKGFRVAKVSESDIRDIYATFLEIELLALSKAIEHGDDAWKASIVAALYSLSLIENASETPSLQIWNERNYSFHKALIAGCNSHALLDIRENIYRRFNRYCQLSFSITKTALHLNHEEHIKLAHATLNRDLDEATALMKHHILEPLEKIIELFKKNNLF